MKAKRIKIGEIGVDAGSVMVGDPCYFFGKDCEATRAYPSWKDVCALFDYDKGCPPVQLKYAIGHDGLGVIVRTTDGDGVFPVFLETKADGRRRLVVDLD